MNSKLLTTLWERGVRYVQAKDLGCGRYLAVLAFAAVPAFAKEAPKVIKHRYSLRIERPVRHVVDFAV